jgi:hypothetical protein
MIYGNKPMIGFNGTYHQTNTVIKIDDYIISIACDDNGGSMEKLFRSEIRVFKDNPGMDDVTEEFATEETICGNADSLYRIMTQIRNKTSKYFLISGYWKDDQTNFEDYIIKNGSYDENEDDDDMIFFYGKINEEDIKKLIGKEDTEYEFVITSYSPYK